MASTYDFVVLGGGHNGLITTAYLSKAGFKVCCLEADLPDQAKLRRLVTYPSLAAWSTT